MRSHQRCGARPSERGATLIILALAMVLLLTLVAFAVDLGQARFSRRDNQQTADLASLAAGYFMAGNASAGGVAEAQPREACEAAIYSVWTNADDFMASSTPAVVEAAAAAACSVFPPTSTACSSTTTAISLSPPLTSGPFVLDIEWPVPDNRIADDRFDNGGIGVDDGDPCERMLIQLDKVEDSSFAGVIGVDDLETTARAVVRGAPFVPEEGIAALVILEREGCATLQASGQGAIVVKSIMVDGDAQQGVIQSDSAGSTSTGGSLQCTTNSNAGGYAIYGTPLPAASGGGPSIVAEGTADAEGIIATYAKRVGGRAACCYPGGLNVEPGESGVTSRTPADNRFNPSSRPAISNLHLSGWTTTVTDGASTTSPTPDHVLNDCNPASGTDFTQTGTVIFNCGANGFRVQNNRSVTISGASTVKFIGGLSIGGGGSLNVPAATTVLVSRSSATDDSRLVVDGAASFPLTTRFYVGGTPTTCTTVNNCSAVSVSGGGQLRVNHEGDATCPSESSNYAVFATFGGIADVAGSVTWCELFMFVGRSQSTYAPTQRTSGGLNCSPLKPCPVSSTANSRDRFTLNGGGSSIVWSAPDQTETPPDASDPYEGLALWVEGTGTSEIKGTGSLETTGVFFLPNALFEFSGQAAASNPKEAQFFTRTLNFSGLGDLNLTPDPNDAVPTPIPGDFGLIR